jgi:hypothetical protein
MSVEKDNAEGRCAVCGSYLEDPRPCSAVLEGRMMSDMSRRVARAVRLAVEAEREACARSIESFRDEGAICADPEARDDLTDLAESIRARGKEAEG